MVIFLGKSYKDKEAMRALFEEEGKDSLLEYSLYNFPKFHHSGNAGFP